MIPAIGVRSGKPNKWRSGLIVVGLAVSVSVLLIASFVVSVVPAVLMTALVACMFGLLWFAFPLTRRR
jgi:hypothetical protein